jgi:hypothetical protein
MVSKLMHISVKKFRKSSTCLEQQVMSLLLVCIILKSSLACGSTHENIFAYKLRSKSFRISCGVQTRCWKVTLKTATVSGQRLGRHVPVARHQILNNTTAGLQQWKRDVSTWSVLRYYKQGTKSILYRVSSNCDCAQKRPTYGAGKWLTSL